MKKTIQVTYAFDVEYEHEEHLEKILTELKKAPVTEWIGTGGASDNKDYYYFCKRRPGSGEIKE